MQGFVHPGPGAVYNTTTIEKRNRFSVAFGMIMLLLFHNFGLVIVAVVFTKVFNLGNAGLASVALASAIICFPCLRRLSSQNPFEA